MSRITQPKPTEDKEGSNRAPRLATTGLREFLRRIEENGLALRQKAGVGPEERLYPRSLATEFKLHFMELSDMEGLAPADRAHIESSDPKTWSGSGLSLGDDQWLIILHPCQTPERATVTTMEEIAHVYYGHKPSRLITDTAGVTHREYDPEIEDEAYWTASAALLPSKAVARRVYRGLTTEAIAAEFGVSTQLVEFRIKTLRLWSDHKAHHRGEEAHA